MLDIKDVNIDVNDKLQALELIPVFSQTVQSIQIFKNQNIEEPLLVILQQGKNPVKIAVIKALLVLYSATNLLASESTKVCSLLNEKQGIS